MTDANTFDREREMVRLIEADHKATVEFIARLTTLRGALLGLIVSLGSALAGLALANDSWIIAVAGIPIVVAAAWAEARHHFLIQVAHNRAVRLEHKLHSYVTRLVETGPIADDAAAKFRRELDTYQFGTSRSLRRPSFAKTLAASRRHATSWLYVGIAAALAVVAVAARSADAPELATCFVLDSGTVIELDELPTLHSGELILTPCPTPT